MHVPCMGAPETGGMIRAFCAEAQTGSRDFSRAAADPVGGPVCS